MWLPESVSQSVVHDRFKTLLPSYERILSGRASARARQGRVAVAAEWQSLLDEGVVDSRAALAREVGVSRARVTQVLSRGLEHAPEYAAADGFVPGDLEQLVHA